MFSGRAVSRYPSGTSVTPARASGLTAARRVAGRTGAWIAVLGPLARILVTATLGSGRFVL